jgi:hypothetical protein
MQVSSKLRVWLRIAGVALVVVLAAALVSRLYWNRRLAEVTREFEQKIGPVNPAAYWSPKVPDEENAAIYLRAATFALVLLGDEKSFIGEVEQSPASKWTAGQRARLRAILERNAPALELAGRAVSLRRSSFGLKVFATHCELRLDLPVLPILSLARSLDVDARAALVAGDTAHYLSSMAKLGSLATAVERETPLVAQMVGIACDRFMLGAVAEGLREGHLDEAALAKLKAVLPDEDLHAAWRRTLGGWVSWSPSEVFLDSGSLAVQLSRRLAGAWLQTRRQEAMLAQLPLIDEPFGRKPGVVTAGRPLPARWSWPFPRTWFPDLEGPAGRFQVLLSQRRLARLALALCRQARTTGAYPADLSAFPEAAVADPFTGGNLAYQRRQDGSAVIEVPGGESLWEKLYSGISNLCPFSWELPAPPGKP